MSLDTNKYSYDTTHALVVVTAKEHGKIFELKDGSLSFLEYKAEHPPTYSDNEGFFFNSSTSSSTFAGGNVREESDEHNLKRYASAMGQELGTYVVDIDPELVLVIEPEHLKGMVVEYVKNPNHIETITIAHGNFVEKDQSEIATLVEKAFKSKTDPADPESVSGEVNAEEKRKILEVGEKISGY